MYSVGQYMDRLRRARRAPATIDAYRVHLEDFSRFVGVGVDDLHNHLDPEHLIQFASEREGISDRTRALKLRIISRFYAINGVKFDELELNIIKSGKPDAQDDKPLTLEALQKMMDIGDIHAKAILVTLVSTGMRAGECSKLLISDVKGDTITIPNRIAKGGRGGKVYLTNEAQEYLALWMKERPRYLRRSKNKHFSTGNPETEKRLFGVSYQTFRAIFTQLYRNVDGERGRYWNRNTLHSTRKYFRTHAVKTMSLDLVEKILRHSGYLSGSYVRISDEEARKQFHAGEAALYITRGEHRATSTEIEMLKQERDELLRMKPAMDELLAYGPLLAEFAKERERRNG